MDYEGNGAAVESATTTVSSTLSSIKSAFSSLHYRFVVRGSWKSYPLFYHWARQRDEQCDFLINLFCIGLGLSEFIDIVNVNKYLELFYV